MAKASKLNPKDLSSPEKVLASVREIKGKEEYKNYSTSDILKAIEISVLHNIMTGIRDE